MKKIAVVTGATGIIGKRIVALLLKSNHSVRILTRKPHVTPQENLEIHQGDLSDHSVLDKLIKGANWIFHCAAEINDETKMTSTNIQGTANLLTASHNSNIEFFCNMSSVGVIGLTKSILANESLECHPVNQYEKTKHEAEKLVVDKCAAKKTVILRPTNVVSPSKPGVLAYCITPTLKNTLKLFLKGNERAHLVHASDVASAALFFAENQSSLSDVRNDNIYIISLDHDSENKTARCCHVFQSFRKKQSLPEWLCLPWQIPYFARKVLRKPCNRGDICYSSSKILTTGFKYPLGLKAAIKDICENTMR